MNTGTRISGALVLCVLVALSTTLPQRLRPVSARAASGTIAYVRPNDATGDEIWLIQPDGSDDRRIWSVGQPDPLGIFAIGALDWRPDASAIAFASDHEFACSIFDSDIYAIAPNGTGYRRTTNGPACASLGSYPKGSVTVTVNNATPRGPFYVYVQGAPGVQMLVVPQGSSGTVTFNDVADFGDTLQQAVVIEGGNRWIAPIAEGDVKPGQTIQLGPLDVSGAGLQEFGAYRPSWHSDNARLGYILGGCASMYQIAASPAAGSNGRSILNEAGGFVFPCVMDWGPTPATANQVLYYSYLNQGIYLVSEGSGERGTQLVATGDTDLVLGLQWLPDGSGFLFTNKSFDDQFIASANIFAYTFASDTVTPLTNFANEFVRDVTISPDGQFVVFERSAVDTFATTDLYVMQRNGSGMRLLAEGGRRPSWSRGAPLASPSPTPIPAPGRRSVYLPLATR